MQGLLDSGCNIHCSQDLKTIVNYTKFRSPIGVKIGDGSRIYAEGFGYFHLLPDQDPQPVLYVPAVNGCIISISQLAAGDVNILFSQDLCTLTYRSTGALIASFTQQNGLYTFDSSRLPNSEYLHQGHLQCTNLCHVPVGTTSAGRLRLGLMDQVAAKDAFSLRAYDRRKEAEYDLRDLLNKKRSGSEIPESDVLSGSELTGSKSDVLSGSGSGSEIPESDVLSGSELTGSKSDVVSGSEFTGSEFLDLNLLDLSLMCYLDLSLLDLSLTCYMDLKSDVSGSDVPMIKVSESRVYENDISINLCPNLYVPAMITTIRCVSDLFYSGFGLGLGLTEPGLGMPADPYENGCTSDYLPSVPSWYLALHGYCIRRHTFQMHQFCEPVF
jgi:hypothetical protein